MNITETLRAARERYRAGQIDEARRLCRAVVEQEPQQVEARAMLAAIAQARGELAETAEHLRAAVSGGPGHATLWNELGMTLGQLGRIEGAADAFRQAVAIDPKLSAAHANLGLALFKLNLLDDADAAYRKLLALDPRDATAHFGIGAIQERRGQFDAARQSYESAIQSDPNMAEAFVNLGNVYWELGRAAEAQAAMQRAVVLNPDSVPAARNLGVLYLRCGLVDRAIQQYRAALARPASAIESAELHSSLLLAMFYQSPYSPQEHFQEHLRWAQRFAEPLTATSARHDNDRSPDRRLHIGYVSADFRRHAVASFIEPILAHHDRRQFEVHCYSNVALADDVTARLRSLADVWHDVVSISDESLAQQIRGDRIDLLIDLSGHTGGNRLLTFARKPAPIQISYLGYMATTGLSAIDYRITDAFVDPPGKTEQFYTEELVRLPQRFFCYQPPSTAMETTIAPKRRASGQLTFGSLNGHLKITDACIEAWSRTLSAVHNSRLWLLAPIARDVADRCYAQFERHGIERTRIEMIAKQSYESYLRTLEQIDIALDTFPVAGHTVTCDTLWMGTPVITLAGETYVSRLGVSVLTNLGCEDLVAGDVEAYVRLAINLAADDKRLTELRSQLRSLMRDRLADGAQFTRQLEAAYRNIWQRWCSQQ